MFCGRHGALTGTSLGDAPPPPGDAHLSGTSCQFQRRCPVSGRYCRLAYLMNESLGKMPPCPPRLWGGGGLSGGEAWVTFSLVIDKAKDYERDFICGGGGGLRYL